MWPGTLIALSLAAAAAPEAPDAWGNVLADVPRAVVRLPAVSAAGPLLRRTRDIFESFFEGEGTWEPAERAERAAPASGIDVVPLPWVGGRVRWDAARVVTWHGRAPSSTESFYGLVLGRSDSWCSPAVSLPPGARLRFQAVPLSPPGRARLEVSWLDAQGRRAVRSVAPSAPADLAADDQ